MTALRPLIAALVVAAAVAVTGCGEEEPAAPENAIEAQEDNSVELNGITYRVALFRKINPRLPSDGALYEGPIPEGDTGVYAVFLNACNDSEERRAPTNEVQLEDAFGEKFPRLQAVSDEALDYDPEPLRPDVCLPQEGGAADRAFPGAAILFEVPNGKLSNRPFVFELQDRDDQGAVVTRRLQVDL